MIRRLFSRAAPPEPPPPSPAPSVSEQIAQMARLVTPGGQPNINALWAALKDLEAVRLNAKLLGYELARPFEARLQAIPLETPSAFTLNSKPVTQGDVETRWYRYWCEQLRERPRYHRAQWAYAYVMQALKAAEALHGGARVLALDSARQPIPSYLARMGAEVTIAQADPADDGSIGPLYDERFCDQPTFQRLVHRRAVNLANPAQGLGGFDALWSLSAACAQGSIRQGMDLIVNAMGMLKPGGLAVHLIEFNFADDEHTLDHWQTVLFQRRHIQALADALEAAGHEVSPLDFHVGHQALDRFIDTPPFDTDRTAAFDRLWRDGWQAAHLKASIDGFLVTSFGLIARRGEP